MIDRRSLSRWMFWLSMLALTTAALVGLRSDIEQSHAAFALLLIVLGGSAGGGRALGYTLAVIGFLCIDYFFQTPYGTLAVGKTLDGVVLVSFLASAFVATELLTRARDEATTARNRTDEVVSLSRLGAETLRYASANEALAALTGLICSTLNASWSTVRPLPNRSDNMSWTSSAEQPGTEGSNEVTAWDDRVVAVTEGAAANGSDHVIAAVSNGGLIIDSLDAISERSDIVAIGIPLSIESRLVGVLIAGQRGPRGMVFDPSRRRFVQSISYYAALGLERVRLAREAAEARELREASRAKDEVLASVSHDLRTPLTTIKLLAHGATQRGDPSGALIAEQTDRLANLVTNVLDLSRIRAGGVSLDIALNTAEDVIAAAISRAEGVRGTKQIVNEIDLTRPTLVARFDFVQTLRILGNVIDNALRYSPENGAVTIAAEREGRWLVISVSDRGPGVAPLERERIFDAFYRPRSEAPDAGHAGLGLSIAHRLAELQGGEVSFRAREGGGSVFFIRLPAADVATSALGELETVVIDDASSVESE
ncbi:MAG: ATP-binding protein [Gemmatimonadaceae bacterium]